MEIFLKPSLTAKKRKILPQPANNPTTYTWKTLNDDDIEML